MQNGLIKHRFVKKYIFQAVCTESPLKITLLLTRSHVGVTNGEMKNRFLTFIKWHDTAKIFKIHIPSVSFQNITTILVQVTLFKKYEAISITSTLYISSFSRLNTSTCVVKY